MNLDSIAKGDPEKSDDKPVVSPICRVQDNAGDFFNMLDLSTMMMTSTGVLFFTREG